jgi:hypothetical protein
MHLLETQYVMIETRHAQMWMLSLRQYRWSEQCLIRMKDLLIGSRCSLDGLNEYYLETGLDES